MVQTLCIMKKIFVIALGLLLCAGAGAAVRGAEQTAAKRTPSQQQVENRQERAQRRAQRMAEYAQHIDSTIRSRNYQFNPQTMQRMPAGEIIQLLNPNFSLGVWDTTVDICLPYIKGYAVPYYTTMLNYTIGSVDGYTAEQTRDGWTVTFSSTLFTASTYTFTLEISTTTGGANLTIVNPWYSPVQYTGTISQLY